jgi:PAS domain S-box-containing protein
MSVSKRRVADYLIALAVVLLATLARWMLDPFLGDRGSFITFWGAVGLASWVGGAGPGMVALVLGALAADYFFIPPRGSLGLMKIESQIGMWMYLFTGSIMAVLAESQKRARASAERNASHAIDRQTQLEAEIGRREQVERERETLLAEQARLRVIAEEHLATIASLFDQSPIGIVLLDTRLRYLKVNNQAAAALGQTPDSLMGLTLAEALAGFTPEAEIAELERRFCQTLKTGEPFSTKAHPTASPDPADSPRFVDWNLRRVERAEGGILGVLGTFVDVTEEVEQGQALRKSEELFRLAAEAIDGLIYDANMKTGRVERTRGMFELLGYQPEEVPPTVEWWMERIHPDDRSKLLDKRHQLSTGGGRAITEYRVRHRDGRYVNVVDRSIANTRGSNTVVRLVGCLQDVTEFRQAEVALREADRRKDEFLAVLAHEIRNPLASIRNSLRLMKQAEDRVDLDGEASVIERDHSMAERQVAHLARLIDDLMDVSRIGRGLIELRREPIELATVLGRAIETSRASLVERGHHFEVTLPDRPIALEADPTRLEQIFGNLLTNAIKYTSPGGRIRVSVEVVEDEVAVKVKDNGLGIEPEMLPKVFGMFVQEGKKLGHAQGGLGIGLGLSKSLVELHGGRISASSEGPGRGSEFTVWLSIAENVRPPENHASLDNRVNPATLPRRRRILIVDDNEDIAVSLSRVLSRIYGQEVRIAHDGPSALELADEFHPEIVLLDIGLPEMDGCEVARRLRKKPEFSETLLVALTGWGQEADRRRSEEAGIDCHLVKPVDPDALGALIAGAAKV